METSRRWIRTTTLLLFVVLANGLSSSLLAAEASPAAPLRPISASLAHLSPSMGAQAAVTQGTAVKNVSAGSERSFFRSRKGVVVLALLAGGFGYAIYSAKNEAIESPVR